MILTDEGGALKQLVLFIYLFIYVLIIRKKCMLKVQHFPLSKLM